MLLDLSVESVVPIFVEQVQHFLFLHDLLLLVEDFEVMRVQNLIYLLDFVFSQCNVRLDDANRVWY